MNDPLRVAVIGGGASGLMAAISAAREAKALRRRIVITIYESKPRVGKKLLVTGNGRCNLSNERMGADFYSGDLDLFRAVYPQFDNRALIDFFAELGMSVRTDAAGRIYPLSNQASSVLDALRYETEHLGIEVVGETKIMSLKKNTDIYILNGTFAVDRVILACGGKAAPVHGSDGSGYELAKQCGIRLTDVFPALTALEVQNFTKSLKGIRAEGRISVKNAGKLLGSAEGELQYTEYGLSGIPAMQVSRAVSGLLYGKADIVSVYAVVDSAPSLSRDQLRDIILKEISYDGARPCEMLLAGVMPKKLGAFLLSELSINPGKPMSSMHPAVADKIVDAVKAKKYKLSGVKGFNDAQVTAGGVTSEELIPESLEIRKMKGLYVCGELADVDGDCGGYNLQWAFSSGYVAGMNAVRER